MRISLGDRYIGDEIDGKCWKEKEKGMNMSRNFPRLSLFLSLVENKYIDIWIRKCEYWECLMRISFSKQCD